MNHALVHNFYPAINIGKKCQRTKGLIICFCGVPINDTHRKRKILNFGGPAIN